MLYFVLVTEALELAML